MKRPVENSGEFFDVLTEWQIIEDRTIASADELSGKANNPIVKMAMEMIKHESERHKIILQMIRDTMISESMHISPDELASLSDMLNRHMEMEAKSLALADDAYRNSGLFSTRFLLSILLADEAKHHGMINLLNELKRASVPTSTSSKAFYHFGSSLSGVERLSGDGGDSV